MKWSKAKTIFIYIFIFVNIFLFAIYKLNSSNGKQTDIRSVQTILSKYNVRADISSFVSFPKTMDQIEVVCKAPEKGFTGALFEKEYAENGEGGLSSETETLITEGTSFTYENRAPSRKGFSGISRSNAPSKALSFVSSLGINKKNLYVKNTAENQDGSYTVSLSYKYGKYPMFFRDISVTENKNGILALRGTVAEPGEIKNQYYNTVGGIEAFIEYLSGYGDLITKEKEVASFGCGYYVSEQPGSVSSFAIPAYEVRFTDGSVIYIDGRAEIYPGYRVLN